MKSALKPFPSRRLSKTKFFYWEPTAANKPTIYLATESKSRQEVGREGGRGESGREGGGGEEGSLLPFLLFFISQKGCNQRSRKRWYSVSHKTMQWPRRRARPLARPVPVLGCLSLVRASTAPLDPAGCLRQPPGLSRFYSVLLPPNILTTPGAWPMPGHSVLSH